ncbi:hypothetical protein [Desulforhopalus sp. IMCC35007]|uniref:hypothetical protein n=1 Tax=Desulforhopalus sp. IMCC35007 TaxID=2569543 RepID=UPI0010AEA55F|nr:hypothetical protein [Desulforhopalus sp. IMCC35007]TKB05671.1 hypothetical protein FCL48_24120 [Desulforhopalus sp. IMCC35007]
MKTYEFLWIFMLVILLAVPASAARFPNAVEKRVVLNGQAGVLIGELFGLNSSSSHSVALQLGRGDAWAVYLLKQDTKEKLSNDNDGYPSRVNVMELLSSPVPSLAISPYWLDLGTRLPETKVGYYSFSSPFVPASLDREDSWTRLLRRLRTGPGWVDGAEIPFQRDFTSSDGIELCIKVFRVVYHPANRASKGYVATITTHSENGPPAPAVDP